MFIINWGDIDNRLDPYYHSGYLMGFLESLSFEKNYLKNIIHNHKNGFAAGYNEQTQKIENAFLQIRPTNFDEDGVYKFEKNIYIENVNDDDIIKEDEILFNNTNSQTLVGKTVYFNLDGKYCCSNHITRLIPNKDIIEPKYLKEILSFYFRNKIFFHLCTNWNNQSGINYSVLKNLIVPVPDKDIQNLIVKIMDDAYCQKKEMEQKADKLLVSIDKYLLNKLGIVTTVFVDDTLAERIFSVESFKVIGGRFDPKKYSKKYQYLFSAIENATFDKVRLRDIVISSISGNWGVDESFEDESLIKCLTIRGTEFDNRYNLLLDNNRAKYRKYPPELFENIKLRSNDILIEKSGGSENQPVGRVAFIDNELAEESLAYSNFLQKIRINEEIAIPEYVFEYLKLMHNIKVTEVMQTQTNGIRNLILKEYFNQTIILPDKDMQKEIVAHIRDIREQAKRLEEDAENIVKDAKKQVEEILLGDVL